MSDAMIYVLIHGAGHDSWCWHRLISELEQRGQRAIAVDLPCSDPALGLVDYADVVLDAMDGVDGPIVLVAHSLAGLTAPIVAARRPVELLVFLGAIVAAPGKAMSDLADVDGDRDIPMTAGEEFEVLDDGTFRFTERGARTRLYDDCDEATIVAAVSHLRPQMSMYQQVCAVDHWPDTRMRSIVCTEDHIVNPEWSKRVARERLGVEPELIPGDHSPFLSRPAELAALLISG